VPDSHKTSYVLAALPRSAHPGVDKALTQIWNSKTKDHAWAAPKRSGPPTAPSSRGHHQHHRRSRAALAFYDYPTEHWIHLRTTNPISSRPSPRPGSDSGRQGLGNKDAGLATVFKLEAAEQR
jgi:putative transposase